MSSRLIFRRGRRSDSRLLPSLSRATPSAVSEHSAEWIGRPISRSLAASCVRLELRLLPSTGITRLHRYYEPLRHPNAPGLSLTGVRLIIPDHASGLPVLRALSLCTCCRYCPGAADGRPRSSYSSIRVSLPRNHYRVILRIVLFEVCSASGRRVGLTPTGNAPPCHGARGEQTFAKAMTPGCTAFTPRAPQLAHDILHGGGLDACGDALSKRARMIRSH